MEQKQLWAEVRICMLLFHTLNCVLRLCSLIASRDIFEKFLLHVALNTEKVFDREHVDPMTSCFIDGELLVSNFLKKFHAPLIPLPRPKALI